MSTKCYKTFALLLLFFYNAQAQINKPSIFGHVSDITTKEALAKATVNLLNSKTQKSTFTQTDEKGNFVFLGISNGTYKVTTNFIGYQSYTLPNVIIDGSKASLQLGELYLEKNQTMLNDVVVTSSKPLVENLIDKLVYNAELDVTSQTGVATDLLKKIPQITVDAQGNVELRGNPSLTFFINGKPSSIFGNSVAEALQAIPATQIKSIEVITSPGAKYELTGTGGIINIILKKNKIEGFNGNLNIIAGTRQENGSINLGYKYKKISFSTYFGGAEQLKTNTQNYSKRVSEKALINNTLIQNGNLSLSRNSLRSGLGLDLDISSADHLSFSLAYNNFDNKNAGPTNQQSFDSNIDGIITNNNYSLRDANLTSTIKSLDWNIEYQKKFKTEKHELNLSYHLSKGKNDTYYHQTQTYQFSGLLYDGSESNNPGKDNSSYLSIGYTLPIGKNFILETGSRYEVNEIISNANVFSYSANSKTFELDNYQTYQSNYQRNIFATYLSTSFKAFRYLDIIAGTRIEYTNNDASYSNATNVNLKGYHNLAPSVTISHQLDKEQSIKFAYSYRIERPNYRDLNPFMNLADPHNIITGNPQLAAELGNNFEIGYNKTFEKGSTLNIAAYFDKNNPDIKPYTVYYSNYVIGDSTYYDVNLTTRKNISSEIKAGLNLSGSVLLGDKITIRGNGLIYDRRTVNHYANPSLMNGMEYRINMNVGYQINKGFTSEAFWSYNSGLKWQGHQPSFMSYTIAIKKLFLNNKASLGIVGINTFRKFLVQNANTYGENYQQTSTKEIPYRSIGFSISYKFGKLKFNQSNKEDNFLLKPISEN